MLSHCQDKGCSTPEGCAKATVARMRSPWPLQSKDAICVLVLPLVMSHHEWAARPLLPQQDRLTQRWPCPPLTPGARALVGSFLQAWRPQPVPRLPPPSAGQRCRLTGPQDKLEAHSSGLGALAHPDWPQMGLSC